MAIEYGRLETTAVGAGSSADSSTRIASPRTTVTFPRRSARASKPSASAASSSTM